jgi:phenylacetic acid degradation operon negative regulatory protein
MLKLMFSEAHAFGQKTLWLHSVIELMRPLGFHERTVRTALYRLTVHKQLRMERHGRHSLCMPAPAAVAAMVAARQRLNTSPARSFGEDWTMLVNSGGVSAARYSVIRKRLLEMDYCLLAPNVLARPLVYDAALPPGMPPPAEHGLAQFDVGGAQLAAAVRQPLFGAAEYDLDGAATLYRQFAQCYEPLLPLLGRYGAVSDEQAFLIRLLVSHGYQHCRHSDPLLPQELLTDGWPAEAAYRTYAALYNGCADQARRQVQSVMASTAPEPSAVVAGKVRPATARPAVFTSMRHV